MSDANLNQVPCSNQRATLEAAPNVTLVKIPGAVFFLPDEAPQQTAEVIASAVAQAT
jgi:hypothetical protein